jgi:diamine N-acetyltransferase
MRSERTPDDVELVEVTLDNLREVLHLRVHASQERFVASNAFSIAEAHFHPEAWFRAIVQGTRPVGFLMLHDENLRPEPREPDYYFLWRLMVAGEHQGRGIGRRAIELLVAHLLTRPNARLLRTSCLPGTGSPERFYLKLGFRPTGRDVAGLPELALALPGPPA